MNKKWLVISFVIISSFLVFKANAQSNRIGVVDSPYINRILSNSSEEKINLDKTQQQYYDEIENDKKELENKIVKLAKKADKILAATIASDNLKLDQKIKAITEEMKKRVAAYSENSQYKLKTAIQKVAAEKGYTAIIEVQNAPYSAEENNITTLVLEKLGIK